jgi:hypothetical protein
MGKTELFELSPGLHSDPRMCIWMSFSAGVRMVYTSRQQAGEITSSVSLWTVIFCIFSGNTYCVCCFLE